MKIEVLNYSPTTTDASLRGQSIRYVIEQAKSWLSGLTVALLVMLLMFGSSFAIDNNAIKASVKEIVDKDSWVQLTVGSAGAITGTVALFTQHPKLGFTILGGTAAGLLLLNKIFLA